MKIQGIFNPYAFHPLKDMPFQGPINLDVVYKDEEGRYYIKYLDTGSFPLLMARLEKLNDKSEKEYEIDKFLNCRMDLSKYFLNYAPIKNVFFYKQICFDTQFQEFYCNLDDYPRSNIIIEPIDKIEQNDFNQAVQLPNRDLYIGDFNYISEKVLPLLNIEGKSSKEIKLIINWLIQNMYLEEASKIITELKRTLPNLDEYTHPKNLLTFDGSTNFLELEQNQIENLLLVKEQTKSLNLKIFNRRQN